MIFVSKKSSYVILLFSLSSLITLPLQAAAVPQVNQPSSARTIAIALAALGTILHICYQRLGHPAVPQPRTQRTLLNPTHLPTNIAIRPATMRDVPKLLDLDRRVTFDHFKQVFVNGYGHMYLGKSPDLFLEKELEQDTKDFPEIITTNGNERLLVAYDTQRHAIAGFIRFHKENDTALEIDLVMVDASYRNQGIGKELIKQAVTTFSTVRTCFLYTLQRANDGTHRFYRSLGFTNTGVGPEDKYTMHGCNYCDVYYRFEYAIF
ncbi:MAG TPA: GNAT family N-acetyltransferase [Candidatus Limnocylindria bacterium]|nr:GNAT family N-acetyltransferase [Candidatus Limnocylindria bacterium]